MGRGQFSQSILNHFKSVFPSKTSQRFEYLRGYKMGEIGRQRSIAQHENSLISSLQKDNSTPSCPLSCDSHYLYIHPWICFLNQNSMHCWVMHF